MAIIAKFFTIALALNLVQSSLQSHFIQDDILAFPRYKVVVTREKVSNTDVSLKHAEASSNTIMMTSSLGQFFSCIIPDVQVEQERLEREKEESTQEETEQDVNKIIEKGLELLEPIGSNCIRFFTSTHQYWAYEYCHNQYVRQFHVERSPDGKPEKEQETASFFLGLYPGLSKESLIHADNKAVAATTTKKDHARVKTELKKNGDQRYLVQKWGDGSRCDLTEKPRTIEVQYHCDLQGQDRVSSFVELSTCNYQIIISTPRLCEDMNLSHRHHIEPHKIKCRPVVSDQLIEQEQQEEREREKVDVGGSDENQPLAEAKDQSPQQANVKESGDDKMAQTDKALVDMISDLTEQINQLKLQMSGMPVDTTNIRSEFSFLTLDDQGNVIPGADLAKLFAKQQEHKQHITVNTEKKQPAKDQHENKQAYQQKYIAA